MRAPFALPYVWPASIHPELFLWENPAWERSPHRQPCTEIAAARDEWQGSHSGVKESPLVLHG